MVDASMYNIDAKKNFDASVDACLLFIRFDPDAVNVAHEYMVYKDLNATEGVRVGHRDGRSIGDLDAFDANLHLIGKSPQKWRSGVKHDASSTQGSSMTRLQLWSSHAHHKACKMA